MKRISLALLVILPVCTFALSCFAGDSWMSGYFRGGGISTILIREGIKESKKVDRALFTEAQDAVITSKGDIYVKVFGRLSSEPMDQTYVIELPVRKRKKVVQKFWNENHHISGMHTLRLKRKFIHKGDAYWEKIVNKSGANHITIKRVTDRKELTPGVNQLYFQPTAGFSYGEETPIFGDHGYWVKFNASPAKHTKAWTKIFIPVTYTVDVITSPIQIPVFWWINSNT